MARIVVQVPLWVASQHGAEEIDDARVVEERRRQGA
jgi:hypothetical protein